MHPGRLSKELFVHLSYRKVWQISHPIRLPTLLDSPLLRKLKIGLLDSPSLDSPLPLNSSYSNLYFDVEPYNSTKTTHLHPIFWQFPLLFRQQIRDFIDNVLTCCTVIDAYCKSLSIRTHLNFGHFGQGEPKSHMFPRRKSNLR